jgi:predicted secreted Zn-dependent protease
MALVIPPVALDHYDVSGATIENASNALPLEAGSCEFFPGFAYSDIDSRGNPEGLTLTVQISIHMPRWTGRDGARPAEQQEWDRFYRALLEHERGHESRIRTGAAVMHRRLRRTLAADLQTAMDEETDKIKATGNAYDAATDHGRRPPPGTIITVPG